MHFLNSFASVLVGLSFSSVVASISDAPLSTSGRWIVDSDGANITFAGVNWPGAADAMLPEGLQYQSISYIVGKVKELGMNSIRLTFAIEMIDDIYDQGGDVPIKTSLITALGEENGTSVYQDIVSHNDQFGEETTRLDVRCAINWGHIEH